MQFCFISMCLSTIVCVLCCVLEVGWKCHGQICIDSSDVNGEEVLESIHGFACLPPRADATVTQQF